MTDTAPTGRGPSNVNLPSNTTPGGSARHPDVEYLVTVDPTTMSGDGTTSNPLKVIGTPSGVVSHDDTLHGNGTPALPLGTVGGKTTINADGVSIGGNGTTLPIHTILGGVAVVADSVSVEGDGTTGNPLATVPFGTPVKTDGTLVGNGTTSSPLSVVSGGLPAGGVLGYPLLSTGPSTPSDWSTNNFMGNATLLNQQGAEVRYNFNPQINPILTSAETAAIYIALDAGFGPSVPEYALYIEIPSIQNYTHGGGGIKILHDGHGDAVYVAILNGVTPKTIVSMTGNGVNPIVCNVPNHGFGQGDIVQIAGALGNTAANGVWPTITVIDANHFSIPVAGNGAYTASSGTATDTVPPIGYEAATFQDGTVGFLSSMQKKGGAASWQGFTALYRQSTLLGYGAFNAIGLPNNAFSVSIQPGIADATLDGQLQFLLLEPPVRMIGGNGVPGGSYQGDWDSGTTYVANDTVTSGSSAYACVLTNTNQKPPNVTYWSDVSDTPNDSRLRVGLYNSGEIIQSNLKADATNIVRNSPEHRLRGAVWDPDHSVSSDMDCVFSYVVTDQTPTSSLHVSIPSAIGGSPQLCLILNPHGGGGGDIDTQGGALSNILNITGALVNFQTAGNQFDHYVGGQVAVEYAPAADAETTLLIRRNVGGSFSLQRVSMGAADSGGSGFKLLRVPN